MDSPFVPFVICFVLFVNSSVPFVATVEARRSRGGPGG